MEEVGLHVMVFATDVDAYYILHFVETAQEIKRFTQYMHEEFMTDQYLLLGPIDEGKQPFLERVSQQFPNTIEV